MNRIAVCTCVAGNYVSYARVLAQSLRRHHPETKLHVLVVDKQPPRFERESLSASVVTLKDLRISKLWRMLLAYDRKQMVVAMKPALLRYVLDAGFESALFLDPDMLVMADLDPVFEAVASHSLTLTPHVGPALAAADKADLERSLLMAGMYNGGFVGISNRPESRRFLAWWEMRLGRLCFDAMQHGLHYDQRWLDLAPAFVEDLHLLRDPGCNFAYWNFPFRALQPEGDGFSVNGSPLRLFHFSGFDPARPEAVTRYVPSLRVESLGAAAPLFRKYAELLKECGFDDTSQRRWPWDPVRRFASRVPVIRTLLSSDFQLP